MRDLERWKDKVELSLDGRQIFFLFFGSAVAACLIFVLGVLIGKRLEARALALQPAPVEDPLAALDQLGEADGADENLTFHKALTGGHKGATAQAQSPQPSEPSAPQASPAQSSSLSGGSGPLIAVSPVNVTAPAPEPKSSTVTATATAQAKPMPAKPAPAKPAAPLPAGKPQVVAVSDPAPKSTPAAGAQAKKSAEAGSSHFTLQLSAFPEKSDAEEFMHKIQAAGYHPFLVSSEVPGKGLFYRVRVGDYATRQAAVDAKSEFERKQRMIAYVAKL